MLRVLLALVLGSVVVAGGGFAVLAWQLAEHPIDMPWLAARIKAEASAAAAPADFRIGGATLAWEGFRAGLGAPIDIRLADVSVDDPAAGLRIDAPRVQLVLELAPLLRGRLRPRSIALLDARATLRPEGRHPAAASAETPDWQSLLRKLGSRVVVRGARISAPTRGWSVSRLDAELTRQGDGGADASAAIAATLGAARVAASLRAIQAPSGTATLHAALEPMRPAALGAIWPPIGEAAARLDAPVGGEADLTVDGSLAPTSLRFELRAQPGSLRAGDAPVPVLGARVAGSWQADTSARAEATLDLQPRPDQPNTHLTARGEARLGPAGAMGKVALDLDRLDFGDLRVLWPVGLASGARDWVLENVTAGVAQGGHAEFGMALPAPMSGLSELHMTSASARLAGTNLTVHWLRPIPPVEHAAAALQLVDQDTLRVDLGTGQQMAAQTRAGELSVEGGRVLITGLSQPDQNAAIRVNVAGSVPNALALLAHPRLDLLSIHPVPLKEPRGQITAGILVSLPLQARVTMDQVSVDARGHIADLHLADLVAGRTLDDGDFAIAATGDGLTLTGTARLAAIPSRITGAVDFRAGPQGQVQQRFTVTGRAEAQELARAGLDAGEVLAGPADLSAVYTQRRDGASEIDVRAGLRDAELRVTPLGWHKPAGRPATARARLILDRASRLRRIDTIEADGVGLQVRGAARLELGGDVALTLDRLILGGTMGQGFARIGNGARMIRASLSGPRLDLSGRFAPPPGALPASGGRASRDAGAGHGPDWTVDASFAEVVLAHGRLASDLRLHVEESAGILQAARLSALTGPGRPVDVSITSDRSGRSVRATAADGGAVLRDLGAVDTIDGGRLAVSGRYLDRRADRPLSGVATLDGFRVRGAPVLAKVLQAMTLFGLVQAVEGPGMTFDHLTAPFVYANGVLTLDDARAFNASLGLTAKGRIDFDRELLALEGTIVPAYMLNTALGRLPLVGRLFSPERGGGVIAARYVASGPLADPAVRVNPLSALTPGFLRGIFGR